MSPSKDGDDVNIPLPGFETGQQQPEPEPDPAPRAGARVPVPTRGSSGAPLPRAEQTTPAFRTSLFTALTGRPASDPGQGDVRSQLITAFGASPRDPSRPDTAAAAKALGVSQRSVQRWVAGQGISPAHRSNVARRARQAMTTKRGRARVLAQTAGAGRPPGRKGQGLFVGGVQGVTSSIADNYRDRETGVVLSEADLEDLRQTWAEHGEEGAAAWLHQHWDSHYVGGWHFNQIDNVHWGDTRNY